MNWWNSYWFRPAPLLDMAILRIVVVGLQLWLLMLHDNLMEFLQFLHERASLPDDLYTPLLMIETSTFTVWLGISSLFRGSHCSLWGHSCCGCTRVNRFEDKREPFSLCSWKRYPYRFWLLFWGVPSHRCGHDDSSFSTCTESFRPSFVSRCMET